MGTWAEGNFANDAALDFVGGIAEEVHKALTPPEEIEDLDVLMAAVAVQKVLLEHCNAPHPERDVLTTLKERALAVYDKEIDDLDPDPEFKVDRRKTIEQTFDEFIGLLDKYRSSI